MKQILELFKFKNPVFVEIRGREIVLAEGYCKIENYSDTCIVLSSTENTFSVKGTGLTLKHLSSGRIAVEGRINSIEFV